MLAAQAPTDAPLAAEVSGDQDRADDRMPAAESGQFSTADFPDSKMALGAGGNEGGGNEGAAELLTLPVLGTRSIVQHQRILAVLLGTALVILTGVTFVALNQADKVAQQVAATGQALMQSQRLAKSVSQALVGSPQAFPDVRESAGVLAKTVRGLRDGDSESGLKEVPQAEMGDVDKAIPLVDRAEKSANTVMSQQKILTQVGTALRTINRQSSDLLEIAETISSLKLQQNAAAAEISASGQLVMLTQRIGKSANEFLTMEGVSPEAVFLLGKDLNSFKEIGQGLLDGSPELRLAGSKDPQTRERLEALLKLYEDTRGQAGAILGNLQGLVSARARRRPRSLPTASRCAGYLKTCRPNCRRVRASALAPWPSFCYPRCWPFCSRADWPTSSYRTAVSASGLRKASAWTPNVRNRKPNASMTPTRPPFCV
jgi:twitching motility protein PilJ